MKDGKLQLITFLIQALFVIPMLDLVILIIPIFPLASIIIHMIIIIVLHKANRKVTGNYLGIIAALISLMSYMFFTINSFNSDSIITPDWPSIFLFISWLMLV